jgi:para-nitrobenzyl esterase
MGRSSALLSSAALALLAACGSSDNAVIGEAPEIAQTANGSVQAMDSQGMRNYFAIPFAAPPLGELRWAPPAAPAKWTTALANTRSAAPCLQTSASPFRLMNGQEDCLYLDVHAPTVTADKPFPVMVWFHGGAFNTGGTVTYADASPLVSKQVIVVTVAYRMGAMGFLGHPALAAADGSVGNYGIMDQQAALHWVRDNIAGFGGDRNNVTIFGESAGGFSVMTHLASPLSKGLFDKAIVESGGYAFDRQLSRDALQTLSTTVVNNALTAAGVTCPAAVDAACLRGLSTAVVSTQLATAFNAAAASPVPSVDGRVLTRSIKDSFLAGENNKVPVINGSNRLEYSLFIAIAEMGRRAAAMNFDPTDTSLALQDTAYPTTLANLALGANVAELRSLTGPILSDPDHYPLANYGDNVALRPSLGASAAGTDVIFACPALNLSKRLLAQSSPVWMYEFRDQTAIPSIGFDTAGKYYISFQQGPGHSYELQYLFNLRDLKTDEHRALQTSMTGYWTNFAHTGDPNLGGAAVAAWPVFSGTDKILGLDVASAGGIKPLETPFDTAHRCSTVWSPMTF